ncbi:MAG: hypothetical protein LBF88_03920 [Planctomycetaceae bacterium]|jgi:hypothetical protein|nr:hypothetical protein [Planctomycetaceae bacterium]
MDVRDILFMGFTYGVPLAVAAAIFGTRWKEGFWGNILSVFAVFFSALTAIAWWESLALLLSTKIPQMLYVADCVAIWLIFLVAFLIVNELTRMMSRVKVKFAVPIENVGNVVALSLLFLTLYGFFLFTMDLSPVGENPDASVPSDSVQIQMLRILSAGNLSSFTEPTQFDALGDFRKNHLERRKALMENMKEKNTLFYEGTVPPRRNE